MDTWTTRELPVLRELVSHFEAAGPVGPPTADSVAAATGLATPDVEMALTALWEATDPYMKGIGASGMRYPARITGVTERARRAVGQWPASDDAADQFLAALQAAADAEPDEQKRSRIRSIASWFDTAGKEVLAKVIAEIVGKYAPH